MLGCGNRFRTIEYYEAKYNKSIDELRLELPAVGSYVIYNEIIKKRNVGTPLGAKQRGIGKVVKYTNYLVMIEVYLTPTYMRIETFQISDLITGLIQWRELSGKLLTKKFQYDDLDLSSLHKDIKALLVDK